MEGVIILSMREDSRGGVKVACLETDLLVAGTGLIFEKEGGKGLSKAVRERKRIRFD